MNWDDYAKWAADIAEWGRDYHKSIRNLPVRAQTKPGEIAAQLMTSAPETGHSMQDI